jgi:hypothetical protein
MRNDMTKLFEATWDETFDIPGTRTVSDTDFHADNGYDAGDVRRIESLQIGETADIDGRHHTVKRIR